LILFFSKSNKYFISTSHLHQNSGNTNIRFTNNTIGSLGTDGFQVGITKSGMAQVRQREREDSLLKI